MKSVCIIGAGPAGLVAAKTFLQTGKFALTVLEREDRLGGIWALDRNSNDGFLSPYTPTNLSRFTCGFSDFDWHSVDYQNGEQQADLPNSEVPMFPKAWMANRYLEAYRSKYIPPEIIRFSCEVVHTELVGEKWNITTKTNNGSEEVREFDYLIMASGFFARPRTIKQDIPALADDISKLPIKIIHSSTFRTLDDLLPDTGDLAGKKILMIGDGNSSGETAAAVALQLSNAQWAHESSASSKFKDCKIVQVAPRPLYPVPPFVEYEDGSRSYVPLDFRLYDFSKRPQEMGSYAGRQTMEVRDIVHRALQGMVGGDLSDISTALVSHKGESRGSVYVTLSESYAEYVRSGLIELISGRVTGLVDTETDAVFANVVSGDKELHIEEVGAVICATGYTPCPGLGMLDERTKESIQFDPTSMRLPIILNQWQTMREEVPSVSFLGFYVGPYWPMIEMQAQLTAYRWLTGHTTTTKSYETEDELQQLRHSMQNRGLDVPQYWFGDYLGYLEDIGHELSMKRNDNGFGEREGCTSPARYISEYTEKAEADNIVKELHQIWQDCLLSGRYTARAAFRALQGNWNISRHIESAVSTYPSGRLEGTASFHPRFPTSDKSGKVFDFEYLYIESGTFTTSSGQIMTARRRYVYRYSEAEDTLSVWFVKPENNLEVDYLFHELEFVKPDEARKAGASIAKADHLCVEDMYWTECRMPLQGVALREFEVTHTVKGPEKDYVANTMYQRPST